MHKTPIDDDLYYDSDDKNYLLTLPEYEREEILYERYNKIIKLKEEQEYEEKLKNIDTNGINTNIEEIKQIDIIEFTEEEIKKMVVNRDVLVNNIYRGDFERFIGQFIRINCINKYVIGLITDINRGETYSIRYKHKNIKTNRHLKIKIKNKEYESVEIKNVSNALPEEDEIKEFQDFFSTLEIEKEIQFKKYKNTIAFFTRPLTDAEITEYHVEKEKFVPNTKSRVKRKIELIAKRDKLVENRKFKEAEEIQDEIDKLDGNEEEDVWATIHQKNRKTNILNAKKNEGKTKKEKDDIYNPCRRRSKYF
ncbi:hypothetical protein SLOPH_1682 [Spraguea lophii 42_110]|uniref:Plus3 domain-containing protein n=1 Tax=Spraguea lophii (strain 42_110) TaxID=1358809 RepID=S7XV51_SPRLO|nr:hypothetical protein SLOPH_1682 [Spraguea lophii 42_110]